MMARECVCECVQGYVGREKKRKNGQNRKRLCERRKLVREKIHTLKIIRTGTSVRVVCAARERDIYIDRERERKRKREREACTKGKITHSRCFGRRALKIKVRTKG